jgi:hypothetical protein
LDGLRIREAIAQLVTMILSAPPRSLVSQTHFSTW